MCSFMQVPGPNGSVLDCSGNGICDSKVTGQCTCTKGFRGADCSQTVGILLDGFTDTQYFKGTKTFFYQYDGGSQASSDFELVLTNAQPMDVYVKSGLANDPTEFLNDM